MFMVLLIKLTNVLRTTHVLFRPYKVKKEAEERETSSQPPKGRVKEFLK